jgi:hypothetical protein
LLKILPPLILSLFVLQGVVFILTKNYTYDEAVHVSSGYSYWVTGEYRMNIFDHPPLAELIESFPLLFLKLKFPYEHISWREKLQYPFGDIFTYHNTVSADVIIFLSRIPVLILSSILGYIIYLWAKEIYNSTATPLILLTLYCFCPEIISHGALATTDFPYTFFLVLTLFFFTQYYLKPSTKKILLVGLCTGLTLAAKFSGIIIIPLLIFYFIFFSPKKGAKLHHIFIFLVSSVVALSLCYRFYAFPLYFEGITYTFSDIQTRGRASFLFGKHSTSGWFYYFPLAFLVKTPISLLVFFILSFYYFTTMKQKNLQLQVIFYAIVIIFLAACFTKLNIGIRHILPVYPLTILFSGISINRLANSIYQNRTARHYVNFKTVLLILLVLLQITSVARNAPHYLSYFNELVGGGKKGYKYLVDSNLDWGQDLKLLKKFLKKENVEEIYFSYFGAADPGYYGIKYINLGFISNIERPDIATNLPTGKKDLLVVSATNLQCTYYLDKTIFNWLKNKRPYKVIGNTLFVYDITNDIESRQHIIKILEMMRNYKQLAKEISFLSQMESLKKEKRAPF